MADENWFQLITECGGPWTPFGGGDVTAPAFEYRQPGETVEQDRSKTACSAATFMWNPVESPSAQFQRWYFLRAGYLRYHGSRVYDQMPRRHPPVHTETYDLQGGYAFEFFSVDHRLVSALNFDGWNIDLVGFTTLIGLGLQHERSCGERWDPSEGRECGSAVGITSVWRLNVRLLGVGIGDRGDDLPAPYGVAVGVAVGRTYQADKVIVRGDLLGLIKDPEFNTFLQFTWR